MADEKVAVLGAGSWGTAVANVLADNGVSTVIWGRDASVLKSIQQEHRNKKYCPDMSLNPALRADSELDAVLTQCNIIVSAIPTQEIRNVLGPVGKRLTGKWIVNASKGIEEGTHLRISEIFKQIAPGAPYLVLSGPSFAKEVLARQPTAVTAASKDLAMAQTVQKLFSAPYFRVYRSTDVVGVELGGALKNVIAIATGIAAGVGFGYNAQAAIINRGVAEILRMGRRLGADPMTFLGLAGMGDLILTCTGSLSRNRRLGEGLGAGRKLDEVSKALGGVAEGAHTTKAVYEIARKQGIDMPITEQIYRILYEDQPIKKALTDLMSRDLKEEWEGALL